MVIDSFSGGYWFLSNFYPAQVNLYGFSCATVEHAYQAAKATDMDCFKLIVSARSPSIAKRMGKTVEMRKDWELVKEDIMLFLLREKFKDQTLKRSLLRTGDSEIIEGNAWRDTYWGVCKGVGKNRLGVLLMQVREELRNV